MSEEALLKVFQTMSFGNGTVKEARLIKENTIYIMMFNEPDLIFEFNSMTDWSLCTAINYISRKDKKHEFVGNN
jgi:hypothetical protein